MSIKEKMRAVGSAIVGIEKQFGKGAVMAFGDVSEQQIDVIPTGSIGLDAALGVGGLPRGRVIEIYGPESSGKTTLTLHAIAEAQKAGGICAFIDAEHALDVGYARKLGVNPEALLISQPDSGSRGSKLPSDLSFPVGLTWWWSTRLLRLFRGLRLKVRWATAMSGFKPG